MSLAGLHARRVWNASHLNHCRDGGKCCGAGKPAFLHGSGAAVGRGGGSLKALWVECQERGEGEYVPELEPEGRERHRPRGLGSLSSPPRAASWLTAGLQATEAPTEPLLRPAGQLGPRLVGSGQEGQFLRAASAAAWAPVGLLVAPPGI